LSTSETIPLIDGELQMGEYQSVFLVELDSARDRRVTVSILGM
ncbi:MAG: YjbQ family protein, partial [Chloroflexi bacterium]|nr:YjbQ family protein [Chloroflexota bacterium]